MKEFGYRNLFIFIITSIVLTFFINRIVTQERFDPKTVQSNLCQSGEMKCGFNPDPIDKIESVPLAESTMISHRGLPEKVDLSSEMPPVLNQGRQNSCVAFSSAYYTKSYYEYKKTNGSTMFQFWVVKENEYFLLLMSIIKLMVVKIGDRIFTML
jgi:hypothetical protein